MGYFTFLYSLKLFPYACHRKGDTMFLYRIT